MTRVAGATRSWCDVAAAAAVLLTALVVVSDPADSASLPGATEYENPVHDVDFPDPFVARVGDSFYGYATEGLAANVQVAVSRDLVTWTRLGNALPFLPEWSEGRAWAPGVLRVGGRYVLYYTTQERRSGLFCVSTAVANGPEGPFFDRSGGPLVCQRDRGGTIDPSPFVDGDGTRWLLFKSDGVVRKEPTRLWSQRLAADGLSLVGPRHELLVTDRPWEGPVIENPAMTRADGGYFLFYSANRWSSDRYAVGWAACDGPAGPCRKVDDGPLVASTDHALGPGGADFFTGPAGGRWIAYHAWNPPSTAYPWGTRSLRIDKVGFAEGRPWIQAPSAGPVPFDFTPGPPPPPPPPPPPDEPAPPPPPPPASGAPAAPAAETAPALTPAPAPAAPAAAAGPADPAAEVASAPAPPAPSEVAPVVVLPVPRPAHDTLDPDGAGAAAPAADRPRAERVVAPERPAKPAVVLAAAVLLLAVGWRAWVRRWKEGSRSSPAGGGARAGRSR